MANHICHTEMPYKSIARAKQFYSEIFKWNFQDFGRMYAMFNIKEGVGGALEQRVDNYSTERAFTIYIQVDDIDYHLKKISEAGGKIIQQKTEISKDFGNSALFADSEGNVVGFWSKS